MELDKMVFYACLHEELEHSLKCLS